MKAFYSLLLIVFFLMQVDAQPIGYATSKVVIKDTVDVTNGVPEILPDSITLIHSTSVLVLEKEEVPVPVKPKTIDGVASFYSKSLEGTETATGETFRHSKFTAASNSVPLNTWVRVTNLKTGKSVVVRINDRMHPRMEKKGRVIDLTIAAAKKIGLTNKIGITKVSLEIVDKDADKNEDRKPAAKDDATIAAVK